MGNNASNLSGRMAISAMSHMMNITKPQLLQLRDRCISVSIKDGSTASGYKLLREKFLQACTDCGVSIEPDYQVFEKLFAMWDRNGYGVDTLTFFAGISPLASVMDVNTKLQFAIEVFDHKQSGRVGRISLIRILQAINVTASYFGDKVLVPRQIVAIVDDLFDGENRLKDDDTIEYEGKVETLAGHPFVLEFSNGQGSSRYGNAQ
mmetsp:Transcript_21321/g.34896  ORF Transcript_21321/g.34896 Transcript_21321/m.34896 type:complete len:206 (+) Transcript_21321:68-685(+)